MLVKQEICDCVKNGLLSIKPFRLKQLGPNSYDVRLAKTIYEVDPIQKLDVKHPYSYSKIILSKYGTTLYPEPLYLGVTVEYTDTPHHVPILEGRSSVARYGILVHHTAGFGDVGFSGHWTLELRVNQPTVIYPNMRIAQIRFEPITGSKVTHVEDRYGGKYKNEFSRNPVPRPATPGNFF